jgi:hypothetical protein
MTIPSRTVPDLPAAYRLMAAILTEAPSATVTLFGPAYISGYQVWVRSLSGGRQLPDVQAGEVERIEAVLTKAVERVEWERRAVAAMDAYRQQQGRGLYDLLALSDAADALAAPDAPDVARKGPTC